MLTTALWLQQNILFLFQLACFQALHPVYGKDLDWSVLQLKPNIYEVAVQICKEMRI